MKRPSDPSYVHDLEEDISSLLASTQLPDDLILGESALNPEDPQSEDPRSEDPQSGDVSSSPSDQTDMDETNPPTPGLRVTYPPKYIPGHYHTIIMLHDKGGNAARFRKRLFRAEGHPKGRGGPDTLDKIFDCCKWVFPEAPYPDANRPGGFEVSLSPPPPGTRHGICHCC